MSELLDLYYQTQTNDAIVTQSTRINIFTQGAITLFNAFGLTVPVAEEDVLLKEILTLETVVSIIEFIWYVGVIQWLPQDSMATYRYYDWFLTTPLMLISMTCYLLYEDQRQNRPNETPLRLGTIWNEHQETLIRIVLSNACMLSAGYLYEQGKLSKSVATAYGFLFLLNTFSMLYTIVGKTTRSGISLSIMFVLWSIYGIAFTQTTVVKNTIYNILDLFSKNFFEFFLTITIMSKRQA